MSDQLRDAAFAIIHRLLVGRFSYLKNHLRDAPRPVIEDFYRIMKGFEEALDEAKKQPWRR